MRVSTGLEALLEEAPARVAGRRIGVLVHPASVDGALVDSVTRLRAAGAHIMAHFGPEHGLAGQAQDMEPVGHDGASARHHSLYGDSFASLSPQSAWLEGLDAVVVDLQDVGSRYYTFVWSTLLMARACAAEGVEVIVCDRPNPLGGLRVAGPPQLPSLRSFVGLEATPVEHGLTYGELLAWRARVEGLDNVSVAPMRGWERRHRWHDTGLPWVAPSPNMPTPDTARVYPGGCLLEGTNLSEGRGTTRPFEWWGAPFLGPGTAFDAALSTGALTLPGATLRPMQFKPMFHKHAGLNNYGVQVHVTDDARFDAFAGYLTLIGHAAQCEGFAWRREAYEFVTEHPAIDLLTGDPGFREALSGPVSGHAEALATLGRDRLDAWVTEAPSRWLYR